MLTEQFGHPRAVWSPVRGMWGCYRIRVVRACYHAGRRLHVDRIAGCEALESPGVMGISRESERMYSKVRFC
jgi:hypothetical protein